MREVNVGHKYLADYQSIVPKGLMAEIAELAEAAQGQARPARERHRVRRRRRRDPLHAGAADDGRGSGGRVARDDGAGGVLHRHQGLPQRPAGARLRADGRGAPALRGRLPQQCRRPLAPLRLRDHPRPAAAGHALVRRRRERRRRALGLALPHRHVHAGRGAVRLPAAVHQPLRRRHLHHARLRAVRPRRARQRRSRPASTRWRPRTWLSRPTTPPTSCASSASTWSGRCCCRCRASTPGRTRWAWWTSTAA